VDEVGRLPGSDQARVRVLATDGVNTGQATSAAFSLAPHPPLAFIWDPGDGSRYDPGDVALLDGSGWDAEDGPVDDPGRLVWRSDIDGELGTGPELILPTLSTAWHQVRLTVTDGDQMTGVARVMVVVGTGGGPSCR
jgi:hypothetical protein